MATRTILNRIRAWWQRSTGRCPCECCTLERPVTDDNDTVRQLIAEAGADYRQFVDNGGMDRFDEHAKRQLGITPDPPAAFTLRTDGDPA